jgi:hypothetical protein
VLAKERVITERVAEEAKPIEPAADRFGLVRVARHASDDRDIGVDIVADRHAFGRFDDVVIFLDPLCRLLGFEECKGQRAEPAPRGKMDGFRGANTLSTSVGEAFAPALAPGYGMAYRTNVRETRDKAASSACWRPARSPPPTSTFFHRDRR